MKRKLVFIDYMIKYFLHPPKKEGKTVPLQAWSGQEGSWKLKSPDFMTTAKDGDMVVSCTHRPHLPPGTHFC